MLYKLLMNGSAPYEPVADPSAVEGPGIITKSTSLCCCVIRPLWLKTKACDPEALPDRTLVIQGCCRAAVVFILYAVPSGPLLSAGVELIYQNEPCILIVERIRQEQSVPLLL